MDIVCIICGDKFTKRAHNQIYCTEKCTPKIQHSNLRTMGISTGTVGAIAELRISSDLMAKGFEVYRALSPASSCDVLAMKKDKIFTFEVRTGHKRNGKIYYPAKPMKAERFAVFVHQTNEILYEPRLPI